MTWWEAALRTVYTLALGLGTLVVVVLVLGAVWVVRRYGAPVRAGAEVALVVGRKIGEGLASLAEALRVSTAAADDAAEARAATARLEEAAQVDRERAEARHRELMAAVGDVKATVVARL